MNYIAAKPLIDDFMKSVTDQSAGARIRYLSWFNAAVQSIVNEPRTWNFLSRSSTLTITTNAITLPTDFGYLDGIMVGASGASIAYFTPQNELTPKEAWSVDVSESDVPCGYTVNMIAGTLTFHPGTTETSCTLYYQAICPSTGYHDNSTSTILPLTFNNLVQRMMLTQWYEFDHDTENILLSKQLENEEMKRMKAWDNRLTPLPKHTSYGYIRERW